MLRLADAVETVKYRLYTSSFFPLFSSLSCIHATDVNKAVCPSISASSASKERSEHKQTNLFLEMAGIQRAQLVKSKTPLELCSVVHNGPDS